MRGVILGAGSIGRRHLRNLRSLGVVAIEPRGSDDLLTLCIYDDKGSAAFQRFSEEDFEYILLVTIALRMLFPDERVGRDGKKIVPVFRPERAKLDELTFQVWLKIK